MRSNTKNKIGLVVVVALLIALAVFVAPDAVQQVIDKITDTIDRMTSSPN